MSSSMKVLQVKNSDSNVLNDDESPARDQTQSRLRISELRYRRLFEAARDGILILDAVTLKITDVNPFMPELLGYSHAEFLGKEPARTVRGIRHAHSEAIRCRRV